MLCQVAPSDVRCRGHLLGAESSEKRASPAQQSARLATLWGQAWPSYGAQRTSGTIGDRQGKRTTVHALPEVLESGCLKCSLWTLSDGPDSASSGRRAAHPKVPESGPARWPVCDNANEVLGHPLHGIYSLRCWQAAVDRHQATQRVSR